MENNYEFNRKRNMYRVVLGIEQIVLKPFLITLLLPFPILFFIVWVNRFLLVSSLNIAEAFYDFNVLVISILCVVLSVIFVIGIISLIGEIVAKKHERTITDAFEKNDLRMGEPILISKKRDKNNRITTFVFYTKIPIDIWMERKIYIQSALKGRLIENCSYYRKNMHKIVVKVSDDIEMQKRKNCYDEFI